VLIALAAASLAAIALRWPGPPLITQTVRVLTGGQDPHPGRRMPSRDEIRTGGNPAVQEYVMSLSHHHQRQLYRIESGLLHFFRRTQPNDGFDKKSDNGRANGGKNQGQQDCFDLLENQRLEPRIGDNFFNTTKKDLAVSCMTSGAALRNGIRRADKREPESVSTSI